MWLLRGSFNPSDDSKFSIGKFDIMSLIPHHCSESRVTPSLKVRFDFSSSESDRSQSQSQSQQLTLSESQSHQIVSDPSDTERGALASAKIHYSGYAPRQVRDQNDSHIFQI